MLDFLKQGKVIYPIINISFIVLMIGVILYIVSIFKTEQDPNNRYKEVQSDTGKKLELSGKIIAITCFTVWALFSGLEVYWYKKGEIKEYE